jgi:hypothetical protein
MAVGQNYDNRSNAFEGDGNEEFMEKIEKVKEKYKQYIEEHDLYLLGGVIDIRKLPTTIRINDEEYWTIEKGDEDKEYEIPESIYAKYMCAKEAGLPCLSLVFIEQFFEPKIQKTVERRREPVEVTRGAMFFDLLLNFITDPMLVWVLPVTDFEGIGFVLGYWNH